MLLLLLERQVKAACCWKHPIPPIKFNDQAVTMQIAETAWASQVRRPTGQDSSSRVHTPPVLNACNLLVVCTSQQASSLSQGEISRGAAGPPKVSHRRVRAVHFIDKGVLDGWWQRAGTQVPTASNRHGRSTAAARGVLSPAARKADWRYNVCTAGGGSAAQVGLPRRTGWRRSAGAATIGPDSTSVECTSTIQVQPRWIWRTICSG